MNHTIKARAVAFLSGALAFPGWGAMTSPDGKVNVDLSIADGRLVHAIKHGPAEVLRPSALGVTVDAVDFGRAAALGEPVVTRIDESYPWRGVKSTAVNRCNAYAIPVTSGGSTWRLEFRIFDDGAAWRAIVPGEGARTITSEASSWVLPAGSRVWYHSRTGGYEGIHQCREVGKIEDQTILVMPVTVDLPGHGSSGAPEDMDSYSPSRIRAYLLQVEFDAGARPLHDGDPSSGLDLVGYSLGSRLAWEFAATQPELVHHPGATWRSRMVDERWQVNTGHRDFRAVAERPALKLRYLAALFSKEVVLRSHQDPRLAQPLEQLVEIASYADRQLAPRGRTKKNKPRKQG